MSEKKNQYHYALSSNQAWAGYKSHQNPAFFQSQAAGENPSIFWIGCSDSRVPEATILGCQPGDVFSHRNLGAIVSPTDINTAAALEFAVSHLKVRHVVLCAHTACPATAAALDGARVGGVLDAWLAPLRAVARDNADELAALRGAPAARDARAAELAVGAGVRALMADWAVGEAVRERGLEVHGCVFDVATGRLRDLGLGTDGAARARGVARVGGDVVRGRHATLVFRDGGATMAPQ